jgi:hypothetical protein
MAVIMYVFAKSYVPAIRSSHLNLNVSFSINVFGAKYETHGSDVLCALLSHLFPFISYSSHSVFWNVEQRFPFNFRCQFIHLMSSLRSLPCDRSIASSKASSPYRAI